MIDFNTSDFNIEDIKHESKLFNFITQKDYRVFGLRNSSGYPPILIRYNDQKFDGTQWEKDLRAFFSANNIAIEFEYIEYRQDDTEETRICIGLRKDLREHVLLSAAIIQTIVYYIENRLELKEYIIPNIPKFTVDAN